MQATGRGIVWPSSEQVGSRAADRALIATGVPVDPREKKRPTGRVATYGAGESASGERSPVGVAGAGRHRGKDRTNKVSYRRKATRSQRATPITTKAKPPTGRAPPPCIQQWKNPAHDTNPETSGGRHRRTTCTMAPYSGRPSAFPLAGGRVVRWAGEPQADI